MTARITRDEYGLLVAQAVAGRADCTRRQVGAVIIAADGSIVSTGYNGLASGLPGCLTAGACPRGQMSYPTTAPYAVGDTDPTPGPWVSGVFCGKTWHEDADLWTCTRRAEHDGWHIAGDGDEVCALLAPEDVQPASVGYEETGCRAVHAEVNAIIRAGRDRCIGATIYVTEQPCFHCSVVIDGAGIIRTIIPFKEQS